MNDPSYGTERSFNGVRLAHALANSDPAAEVTVLLMAVADPCAKSAQKTPDGHYSLGHMPRRVGSARAQVLICSICMDVQGLAQADIMDSASRSTRDEPARKTLDADGVIVF